MKKKILAIFLSFTMTATLFSGCGQSDSGDEITAGAEKESESEPETNSETETESEPEETVYTNKDVIVYFANWNLDSKAPTEGGEVASIPWDRVTYINHAFWAVAPADGSTATSVEQRQSGNGARTEFKIVSTNPQMDYQDTGASAIDSSMERNHFAEYAAMSEKYPDVNIMISIGGWSASGYFSEMAYTPEGRASFINSCIDLMDQYPWIDGIDIDWEYPGGSKDGERAPENENDQGCPIFGSAKEDSVNFAALLSEMETAFDQHYGKDAKKMTACASASTGWTLPMQDWAAFAPYLDRINIMTYDLAGVWDGATGHASSFFSSKSAAVYFKTLGIPMDKLCIGSPMYSINFLMTEITANPLGAKIEGYRPNTTDLTQKDFDQFEAEAVSGYKVEKIDGQYILGEEFDNGGTGWHMKYDSKKDAPYLYNDDESSPYYKWFISYENELSLQAKLNYINEAGLAGIIVWECSQDTNDSHLISEMAENLIH